MTKMDEYRVALIVPLFCEQQDFSDMVVEYLGFGYIASYLRNKEILVDIIDPFVQKLTSEEVVARVLHGNYNLLGFTLMSSDYLNGMQKILNQLPIDFISNVHIMVGGYYPTFQKQKLFTVEPRINSLIVGEGEVTIAELVDRLRTKEDLRGITGLIYTEGNDIVTNKSRALMSEEELDRLPLPARDHIDTIIKNNGSIQILSSRGCFGQCTFCAVNVFYDEQPGRKWRSRSPESVVKEIEELVSNYNITYLHFSDEEFVGPGKRGKERARKIAELILKKNINIRFSMYCRADSVEAQTFEILKQAGLDSVFLGVEFGVQKLLDYYKKGITLEQIKKALFTLESLKIKIKIGYIMFEPTIDLDSFRENLKFCYENTKFTLRRVVSQLAVYPNSKAYWTLHSEIEMDEQMSFDRLFGDHYKYKFKHKKTNFLYRILKECLGVISPSKKYLEILKETSLGKREIMIKDWATDVYKMIDAIAATLILETNLSEENFNKYCSYFKNELLLWDSDKHKLAVVNQKRR
ncbi:B12-binding domain-containing radical SAM protein [Paenibacillus pseudetheri]|uniref:Radical SAM protein n=1 Tax=Paenibacillus pseudetheri TaxID=2897682 RepID=A0ABN8FTY1_9BACL|nr:radical SAM protein [Paenibacillus pseudetheri]CAH1059044.1 hypothetical protein PAECIP111894_05230 [Paenibacillus pseudetheri]